MTTISPASASPYIPVSQPAASPQPQQPTVQKAATTPVDADGDNDGSTAVDIKA